ncbi:MAG: hypothetical protein HY658_11025 [Actinobacteria bacterium]|nr:hypothetical protein [Actinomycetota bacterium]
MPPIGTRRARPLIAAALAAALVGAACSGGGTGTTTPTATGPTLTALAASYEVLAGEPSRVIVGLLVDVGPDDRRFVSFGTVRMRFSFLGTQEESLDEPEPGAEAEAAFLAVHGTPDTDRAQPIPTMPSEGRGVYGAEGVVFDRAGFWEVEVTADIEVLGELRATAAFEVTDEPIYPAPGQPAPRTENLTVDSSDAPRAAIDSRAGTGDGEIPDPELHEWTIARAVEEGRPALVVFSTPVFCISQFCGPVTDLVQELAAEYGDRAAFIHVEIWRDFQTETVNRGAAEWLLREGNLTEPWLFLIGADGRIVARWDNLFTREEVEPYLRDL